MSARMTCHSMTKNYLTLLVIIVLFIIDKMKISIIIQKNGLVFLS